MITSAPRGDAAAPHAVEFDGVSRRFGGTLALDDCRLVIEPGETVALLGRNGAGKTTAISLMLGLLAPTSGRVHTLGLEPPVAVRAGRVGAMLQAGGLPVGALVGELVDLACRLAPDPLPRDIVLGRAGLASLARRRVDSLSGGESQRVRFAMAIAGDPNLVFLDEPTVAMDVESRRAFWDDMRRSAAEGRTVLFATHYLDEADQIADRIVILDHGRILAEGSPAALKASVSERALRFELGDLPARQRPLESLPGVISEHRRGSEVTLATRDADETVRGLVREGVAFRHLEVVGPDLEAAFLALTAPATDAAA